MIKIFDSLSHVTLRPVSFKSSTKEDKLKRNTAIGTGIGLLAANLLLTRGNLKNLPKIEYGIKEVMALCTAAAVGGYAGANFKNPENKKGRKLELKNQLIYNDLLPLICMEVIDKTCKVKNKLVKSIVLAGSLLASTFACHKLAKKSLEKSSIKNKEYPVEAAHLIAEADDYLLPVAVATKWKWLQNFLKVISPITFFPLGMSIGKVKDEKYF